MASKSSESGLDELIRLSRATTKMGQDVAKREQQQAEHSQKMQGTVQGLREISFSVALEQLKFVATPELIEEIRSLSHEQGAGNLRKLISGLTRDLEKLVDGVSASNPDITTIQRSVKTLAILIGLLFSIQ